ncbi:bilobe protein [Trypanosoma brucei equiperdum]|uniref:Bilobe protein n=1 Tax=Trypanosoma brucei equiperdum TaxID=630700 RepID=A0A3L6L0V8_9TRYP|nr:bilobe protein [Trypanosoma brucei equiperdum]
MAMRRSSPSPRPRVRSASVASIPDTQRCEGILSSRSIAGTARSIEYVGDRCVWAAAADGRVLVYSLSDGEVVAEAAVRENTFCTVLRLVSRRRIWAGFADGFICCYDSSTANLLNEFVQHDGAVNCLATTPYSEFVYSGGEDWKVYQWLKESCTYVRLFSGHSNAVRCVVAHVVESASTRSVSEGVRSLGDDMYNNEEDEGGEGCNARVNESMEEYIISGSDDMTIKIWDPRAPLQIELNLACLTTLRGHNGGVHSMEVFRRKQELWSGDGEGALRVWDLHDVRKPSCVAVLEGQHSASISSIVRIDSCMWSSGKDSFVVLWDAYEKVALRRFVPGGRAASRPIFVMRRLYRAAHWVIWLGGLDRNIHSLSFAADGDIDGKLLRSEKRCAANKLRYMRLQERTMELCTLVEELEEKNKALETQVQQLNALLHRSLEASQPLDHGSGRSRSAGKGGVTFRRLKSDAEGDKAPSRLAVDTTLKLPSGIASRCSTADPSPEKSFKKDVRAWERQEKQTITGDISDGQKLIDQMELITSAEFTLQDVSGVDGTSRLAFEAYKKEVELKLVEEELSRQALQRELAEATKYKTMWETKNDALRDAYEQIENLQRNLEGEQRYVNDLLQEMAQLSNKKVRGEGEEDLPCADNRTPTEPREPSTGYSLYKSIPGNYWDNICTNYPDVLRDTLFSELSELVSSLGAVVTNIAYASTGECLLVEAVVGPTTVGREKMQSCLELHAFPQTRTLHESMSTPFRKGASVKKSEKDNGWKLLVEAKERAEMERDEALAVLQEATDELEAMYEYQRQVEERRAKTPGLCDITALRDQKNSSVTSSTSQACTKVPIYVATAEEYEEVLAVMGKVERERDEALQLLQKSQANSVSTTNKATSTSFIDSQHRQHREDTAASQTVSVNEYSRVVAEKEGAEAECREARRKLQKALHELESLQKLHLQAEEEWRKKLNSSGYSESSWRGGKKPLLSSYPDGDPTLRGLGSGEYVKTDDTDALLSGEEVADHRLRGGRRNPSKGSTTFGSSDRTASADQRRSRLLPAASDIDIATGHVTPGLGSYFHNFAAKEEYASAATQNLTRPVDVGALDLKTSKFSRYRCMLGEMWGPLVKRYRALVEDVFLMEVFRATSIPPNYVKGLEFGRGGLFVEVDIYDVHSCENVNLCLQRHKFSVLDKLIRLSQSCSATAHDPHQLGEETSASQRGPGCVAERNLGLNGESRKFFQQTSHCIDEAQAKELDAFRCRRAFANSLRRGEETLRSLLISQSEIDPKVPVDSLALQREPIYCVTLDEYRCVLRQLGAASRRVTQRQRDISGDEQTRLWNEHVVKQAEKERRFARRLSHPYPQFAKGSHTE